MPAGKRTDALVQYADVLPTLLELAGGNPAASGLALDGTSFAAVLRGEAQTHRTWVYGAHNNIPEGPAYPVRTVTDGQWRYIRNLTPGELYIEKHLMGIQGGGALNNPYWPTWIATAWDNPDTYRLVKRYMQRQGADPDLAEDLAQETLVQVWRKAAQYDPAKAAPSAWVFTVARNLRIDRLRRQRLFEVELTEEADAEDEHGDGHQRTLERLDAGRLTALVETLPTEQVDVIRLAYFEGLSHAEVGRALNVPLGTVKSRLRLALAKLRTAMGLES